MYIIIITFKNVWDPQIYLDILCAPSHDSLTLINYPYLVKIHLVDDQVIIVCIGMDLRLHNIVMYVCTGLRKHRHMY